MEEDEIIRRIQAGETGLFESLLRNHQAVVLRSVARIAYGEEEADEVVQEAFFRAFVRIRQFGFRSSFRTWVISIAMNHARDLIRRHKRFVNLDERMMARLPQPVRRREPDEDGVRHLLQMMEREAVRLSAMQKSVLFLRMTKSLSVRETAQTLGISEGAVKSHLNRVVERFRKKFRKPYERLAGEDL